MKHFYLNETFENNWFNYQDLYSFFVSKVPSGGTIVEVGSWKGMSAAYLAVEIINSGKQISLFCVDTWEGSGEHQEDLHVKNGTLFDLFARNIESVSHVVSPMRMDSITASKHFADKSIDVVFMDADHSFESVSKDIASWLPKVKDGGYIGGHDYHADWPGVIQAVKLHFNDSFQVIGDSWLVEI